MEHDGEAIFRRPRHPTTKALSVSAPFIDPAKRAERVVGGTDHCALFEDPDRIKVGFVAV
ncbi:hypothetical protein KXS07_36750 [Inquilinus limosus]|uniref:hypothetical protein n=1 Tax=Inquilinus limosus TaxID=171674 RepID=UPI003F17C74E